jgi:autotransporter-associated beta strand protein
MKRSPSLFANVLFALSLVAVCVAGLAGTASAAITWNVAGGGAWDAITPNWLPGPTTFTDDGTVDVIFNNTAGGTIAIAAGMSPLSTTVSATSGTYTFTGAGGLLVPAIDSGTLTKSGGGTLMINCNNTYAGKTTILGGTLRLGVNVYLSNAGVSGPLGMPTGDDAIIDIYGGATLRLGNTSPRQNQTTDRTINLAGDGTGTMTLRVNDNDTVFTFGAVTTSGVGPKTLALLTGSQGNGDRESLVFNGALSDTVDAPLSLQVTFRTQTGSQSYVSLKEGGTFTGPITLTRGANVTTSYFTVGGVRTGGGNGAPAQSTPGTGSLGVDGVYAGNISLDTTTIFNYYSSAPQTLSGLISGAGAMMNSAAGTLTLTGINTYTGTTTVSSGTLEIGGDGQLGSGAYSANIPISGGATLKYNSTADQVLSGVISNAGSIVKDNTGMLTLSGANSGAGSTTVNGGILRLSNATALSTGPLAINDSVVELAAAAVKCKSAPEPAVSAPTALLARSPLAPPVRRYSGAAISLPISWSSMRPRPIAN